MKNKIFYISTIAILVALCAIFYFSKSPVLGQTTKPALELLPVPTQKQTQAHQKCPDEYADNYDGEVEYQKAFIEWTFSFRDTYPKTIYPNQLAARLQFLADNNCTVALQRYAETDTKSVAMGTIERGDKESIDYIKLTPDLHKICPFYEPDGVSYRDCAFSQLDKESAKFDLDSEMYKEIETYCKYNAIRGADWYTLGFIDDYNACVYYKLKQAE